MPPEVVFEVARSVAKTLEVIHQRGLLHRDIKPDNIFFTQTGRIVLIDFGSVRAFVTGKTLSHTRLVTPGYAPLEQYGNSGRFGPYTDIYALGATLLHALTGQMPPPATDLMLGTPLPPMPDSTLPGLRRAVTQAMALRVEDRPQSAQALLAILMTPTSKPGTAAAPLPVPSAPVSRPAAPQSPTPPPPAPRPSLPKPGPAPVRPVVVAAETCAQSRASIARRTSFQTLTNARSSPSVRPRRNLFLYRRRRLFLLPRPVLLRLCLSRISPVPNPRLRCHVPSLSC